MNLRQRMDELRALEQKAAPGPWLHDETHNGSANVLPASGGLIIARCDVKNPFDSEQTANAALIAALRNTIGPLLDVVEVQHRALERLLAMYAVSHSPETRKEGWDAARAALALMDREEA